MKLNEIGFNNTDNKITESLLQDVEYLSNKYDTHKPTKSFKVEMNENSIIMKGKTKDDVICELRNNKYDLNNVNAIYEINEEDISHNLPDSWAKTLNENGDVDVKYLATLQNKEGSSLINEASDPKSYNNVLGIYFTINEKPLSLIKLNKKPIDETKNYRMIVPSINENSKSKYEEKSLTLREFKENYLPKKKSFKVYKITE